MNPTQPQLHAMPLEQNLQVEPHMAELVVQPVSRHRIYRTYTPAGSPTGICQQDEAMEQKFGQRVDEGMAQLQTRMRAQGLRIKVLYMNGKMECASTVGGPDQTIVLDVTDPDLQALRSIFIEAGWKTEHWQERSPYIKGSNHGVIPFQRTTARLEEHKDNLKEALLKELTPALRGQADARLNRWQEFRRQYPEMIRARRGHYQERLEAAQTPAQKDFIQRILNYFDQVETRFNNVDATVIELALCSPIGGGPRSESVGVAAQMVRTLTGALVAEKGPAKQSDVGAGVIEKVQGLLRVGQSSHNDDLAMEEAVWASQVVLMATWDPDTQNERLLYDDVREKLQTDLAPLRLHEEERLGYVDHSRRKGMMGAIPRLEPTRDTLESAIFKFIMLGETEATLGHPNFKVLWDGFPAAGTDGLPPLVLPPQESAELRQGLVNIANTLPQVPILVQ